MAPFSGQRDERGSMLRAYRESFPALRKRIEEEAAALLPLGIFSLNTTARTVETSCHQPE